MNDVDDQFYERADAHIHLSNDQITEDVGRGKVSSSTMYSTARFNAWVSACSSDSREEMISDKNEMLEYFVSQYRKMLDENLDDYIDNFNEYMGVGDKPA
jgi:trimethylamine:corrinoid methyltransferase-like protein